MTTSSLTPSDAAPQTTGATAQPTGTPHAPRSRALRASPDLPGDRPLPRSFDGAAAAIAVQAHLAALVTVWVTRDVQRPVFATLLVLAALAVPLGCILAARRTGGELGRPAFVAAAGAFVVLDVLAMTGQHGASASTGAMWAAPAIGVSLLVLSPYRPPREILTAAGVHAAVTAVLVLWRRGSPGVDTFGAIVAVTAALFPALAAAHYVRHYVQAVRERERALSARTLAEARAAAATVIRQDAVRRLDRLRSEVLPLLTAVASGERPVDDPHVARLAQTLSADLRRELVEARSGSWLLEADHASAADGPGAVLLDPQRLVRRMAEADLAALSAVLDQLRRTGSWSRLSVALSPSYQRADRTAFLTVVAQARAEAPALTAVDPAVLAVAERLNCRAVLEPPDLVIVEGSVGLQASAR